MTTTGRRHRPQAGFTLVELMISLVLFAFAIAGVLSVAVSLTAGFREQRQAVMSEGAVRAAMDFVADAVRSASPAMTGGAIEDLTGTSGACATGSIKVTNSTSAPDSVEVVFAYGAVATSLRSAYTSSATTVTVTDASNFIAGDTILLTDGTTGHLVHVNAVNGSSGVLTLAAPGGCTAASLPASGYPIGTFVLRALRANFYIGTFDGQPNTLLMDPGADGVDPEPLAENIEDMQIATGVEQDSPSDGIQSDEWFSANTASLTGAIRALRITLVARTTDPLRGGGTGTPPFFRPLAEDHPAALATDWYRRRVLTSTVEIRNLLGSP